MEASDDKKTFDFVNIISRSEKPREKGLSMVLDKGFGLNQVQDLMEAAHCIDIIKLAWATPRMLSERMIKRKISLYRENNILVGNGGTLLEIVYKQKKTEQFFEYCCEIGVELIEVSNGVLSMSIEDKADIIRSAKSKGMSVISEVGKKNPLEDSMLTLQDRINEAESDLKAGAHYVIIEAREGGRSIGVYDDSGGLKEDMAKTLVDELGIENIMFEAPDKSQQARLILLFGSDVNLGNIRPEDVIALETLRRGIRGDTFGKL